MMQCIFFILQRRRLSDGDDEALWEVRLAELREFLSKYGHCRVPQAWKENKKLGSWVARVRNRKRKNKLQEDKVKALEEIGIELQSFHSSHSDIRD